jgi:site-specific recombinase XerD
MIKRQEISLDSLTLGAGDTLFISERRTPLSRSMVWLLMQRYAKAAGLEGLEGLNVHPHMLRHACGFDMAHRGTDTRLIQRFLGHKNIQHTVQYTELDPTPSDKNFRQCLVPRHASIIDTVFGSPRLPLPVELND